MGAMSWCLAQDETKGAGGAGEEEDGEEEDGAEVEDDAGVEVAGAGNSVKNGAYTGEAAGCCANTNALGCGGPNPATTL